MERDIFEFGRDLKYVANAFRLRVSNFGMEFSTLKTSTIPKLYDASLRFYRAL